MHEKYAEYSRIYHEKVRKKTYLTVKSYTALFYDKNISEVTVEDIQKLLTKKQQRNTM
ncbi:putative integrase [Orientia tsutsugamushi str. UT76]|nr:putative integrase [Orientia tsutsugamushi str. UT76]